MPTRYLEHEEDRLAALRGYAILDTAAEQDFDDLAELAAAVCDAPVASIALVDSDRVWLKARTGLDLTEIPRELALTAASMLSEDVFVVPDAALDERYREMAATEDGIRFFACAPLVAPGGERLGGVCVLDHCPRDLTSAQADALRAIARQVITQLELRRVSQSEGAARRRFRMLVEQLPGVTYIEEFGASSASYVSPQMEALNGWPPDEWAADPELFGKVLHPEDRERVLTAFAKAHAAFDPIQIEYRMVARDGRIVWVHDDSAVARDDDGTPLYLQGYMTDITLRKQSELELRAAQERYRTLAEQLPLLTYIDSIEIGGPMTYISPQIKDLVGYTAEEWLADPAMFTKCLHPDDRDAVLERERRCKTEGLTLDAEYRLVGRDGKVIWVHDTAVPVRDEDGVPCYWQGYAINISERRAIESQRDRLLTRERAQNERLRELDRMKDEFVALVSHELRTPLTSIRGYLELVLDDTDRLDEEHRRFLEVVERNADRLLRLVGDLLFVAQVEAGKLTLDRGEVDLGSVVRGCVEAAEPVAAQSRVELLAECGEVPSLSGDPARLAQLVDNLLSNAIKFTPADGRVSVRVAHSNGVAVLEVADTGPGIALDEQGRLFERFFRARSATENATPGTGLGLSIAKAITEAHGGSIAVSANQGLGACFRVELPIGARDRDAA